MKHHSLLLAFLALGIAFCALASPAHAQATRTWVSGVGDDANPCSRTAPCKTWAGAISKTSAGGEIDALDPGGYGALTITKTITLDGGGGQVASTLVAGTNGIVISAGSTDVVTLRNVHIQGLQGSPTAGLNGIQFNSGAQLNVENCDIERFAGGGVVFQPSATNSFLNVINSIIEGNVSGGVLVMGSSSRATIAGSSILNNTANTTGNGPGIYGTSGTLVAVFNSIISNNKAGIISTGAGAVMSVSNSVIVNNLGDGLVSDGGANLQIANSTISDNAMHAVATSSGGLAFTFGNNIMYGNGLGNGIYTGGVSPAIIPRRPPR